MAKKNKEDLNHLLDKVNEFLKREGDLGKKVHVSRLMVKDTDCQEWKTVTEVRTDPRTGKKVIVLVRKCVDPA